MPKRALEIADIFRAYGPAWRGANKGHVSLSQLKVMSSIEACRTEELGGHVAACTKCNHQHIAYNSCKNRHCPKCQGPAARDWLAARAEDLLPVEYFHLVFTLPAEIARIAYWNKKAVYGLLFRASAQTVTTIASDPKRMGARVGMTSVLHTWGSALTHHPHVHMSVPGGGLSPDGTRWASSKPEFFLHVRVLSRLFRRLFIEGLLALHRVADLAFFGDLTGLSEPQAFAAYLAPLRKTEWIVYSNHPSVALRLCWLISVVTRTVWPSQIAASSMPMPTPLRSDGKTIASRMATNRISCASLPASSSVAF